MTNISLRSALLVALTAAASAPASAGELRLTMQDGRVTLIAEDVSVRQILQEWERVGQTKIVNIEKISGANVTLQLVNKPERDALDVLLRSANGYIAAPRSAPVTGAAMYDRITIFVSTTKAPAQVAGATPPTFQRPPQPDDSDEPINVQVPQQMVNPGLGPVNGQMPAIPPQLPPQLQQQLLQQQQQLQLQQQQQQPTFSPTPGPLTSPRPGALPQPSVPGAIPNPYQPVPTRPGGGGPGGPGGK
jgi:hypothetical protein